MPPSSKIDQSTPTFLQWQNIGIKNHIGINLPLSALKTEKSSGIGEFLDLLPLFPWCAKLGMDIIQLLPINDTGFDPSPYNILSSCALHPIYLSLHKLPYLEDPDLLNQITDLRDLNTSEKISFSTVLTRKMSILFKYYQQYGNILTSSTHFTSFVKEHSWLRPYALFKVLQHNMGHVAFSFWPDDLKYTSKDKTEELFKTHEKEMLFYLVLQYLCFTQMKEVKEEARKYHIFLKGDLPILISPDSADVWFQPEFFNLDVSIGAPPDNYCKEGQNWGFPAPRWSDIKKTNFSWWRDRLKYASYFYDIYRIDHAVGLFRLWAIPRGHQSKEGYFIPGEEHLWGPHGKELLDVLCEFPMLPIAEDLGTIPNMVRPLLQKMGIPGTKVMRWERDWEGDLHFLDPLKYPRMSLTCISTHDSPTLEQWWRDYPVEAKTYAKQKGWDYSSEITYLQRQSLLKESVASSSLFHINLFSEYLALLPEFVSPNPDDERINVPGTLQPSNWSYRFRRSLEEITSSYALHEEMEKILWP